MSKYFNQDLTIVGDGKFLHLENKKVKIGRVIIYKDDGLFYQPTKERAKVFINGKPVNKGHVIKCGDVVRVKLLGKISKEPNNANRTIRIKLRSELKSWNKFVIV